MISLLTNGMPAMAEMNPGSSFDGDANRAAEELVDAEVCLAAVAAAAILAKFVAATPSALAAVEKAVKTAKTVEERIAAFVAAASKYLNIQLGQETAKWIVTKFLSQGIGLAAAAKAIGKMCANGALGVARATKDLVVVGGGLAIGSNPDDLQKACNAGTYKPNSGQCTALACWKSSSRGIITTLRTEALNCCSKMGLTGDALGTCRNWVNNIADQSGW